MEEVIEIVGKTEKTEVVAARTEAMGATSLKPSPNWNGSD